MAFQADDEVVFYFVILEDRGKRQIKAWSMEKDHAKFYIEFHKCSNMRLKQVHGAYGDICRVLEENLHDEIGFCNIEIRNPDPNHKKKDQLTNIVIPATSTEVICLSEECSSFCASMIDYGYINSAMGYLKPKYQSYLKGCLLQDIIRVVIHNTPSPLAASIKFDQLAVLTQCFSDHFGT